MKDWSDIDKLRVLIPHWIEHNEEHASEFRAWAAKAGKVRMDLMAAAEHIEVAISALEAALEHLDE